MCCSSDNTLKDKNFSLRSIRDSEFRSQNKFSESVIDTHAPKKTVAAKVDKVNHISNQVKEVLASLPEISFEDTTGKISIFRNFRKLIFMQPRDKLKIC